MAIDPDDEGEYGPAMQALSPLMRRFVLAMIENPLAARWRAAEAAGYSATSNGSLRVTAHRLMHDERVISAVTEESGKRLRSASLLATSFLEQMILNEEVPFKDRAKVAIAMLDRGGFGATQNINVNKTVTDRTGPAMLERIRALAAANGLDPAKLLGTNVAPVVDAEFSEVGDAE